MIESCISADAGRSLALGLFDMEQANRGLMVKRIKSKQRTVTSWNMDVEILQEQKMTNAAPGL